MEKNVVPLSTYGYAPLSSSTQAVDQEHVCLSASLFCRGSDKPGKPREHVPDVRSVLSYGEWRLHFQRPHGRRGGPHTPGQEGAPHSCWKGFETYSLSPHGRYLDGRAAPLHLLLLFFPGPAPLRLRASQYSLLCEAEAHSHYRCDRYRSGVRDEALCGKHGFRHSAYSLDNHHDLPTRPVSWPGEKAGRR